MFPGCLFLDMYGSVFLYQSGIMLDVGTGWYLSATGYISTNPILFTFLPLSNRTSCLFKRSLSPHETIAFFTAGSILFEELTALTNFQTGFSQVFTGSRRKRIKPITYSNIITHVTNPSGSPIYPIGYNSILAYKFCLSAILLLYRKTLPLSNITICYQYVYI